MRPEILFPLFAPITSLKGVGPRVAPLLERVAGPLVRDVLWLRPHSLIRRTPAVLSAALDGQIMTFEVVIEEYQRPRTKTQPWRVRVSDPTGFLTLVFFGRFADQLEQRHPVGALRIISGRVEDAQFGRQMLHPDYMSAPDKAGDIPEIEPVYPATEGLPARRVRVFALDALEKAPEMPEWQDLAWLAREKFPAWREALGRLHAPQSEADLSPLSLHRRRLAYDELLAHQLAMAQRKAARRREPAARIPAGPLADRIRADLPFVFTGAQERALAEVRGDLQAGERMSRLVQGDVGSGKTVVAMCAMADVADAGGQSALMAPTEILARQHYETISGPLAAHGVGVVLLTGRDKGAGRKEKLAALASGAAQVAVGTHALFQDEVAFQKLQLVVVDEQHRFGVAERQRLQAKGQAVHLIAMSATPIPRTLELTMYGDLDVSRIDEKPPGRTPVATRAVPMGRLDQIIDRLKDAVAGGAQAFWICPLVSESELSDLAAAEMRAIALKKILGDRVGLVHGKLSGAEKDAVMADFADNKLSVLVATTVVEVGVNVPNATIMVIEQAERFGLAQLHQLRGRVGRGSRESSCVLLYDPPLSETAQQRLDILRRTDDGFVIAEKDLELRGGGDALGLRQSGLPDYVFADPFVHRELIAVAGDDARLIVNRDPDLTSERGQALRVLQELFDWKAGLALRDAG
ncbi:MAG: ATP-dependent DNA helicase RecG [Alphaproteobacteria bacterium]|nr:ATP-dependent DNA helicase RecG [Alphaproteobacteria bacterium]MBU1513703.1 ATP-dependent DNA helicase RecG [Alphaproteobacteria bacterium]MBU2094652.1 ATP-dependent DNA helicase RecG [Alphaproteobacteria bacterium]MBU2150279.1 ATP-dependent DNA helicase RecG [Alphaproteobacteria bacterium]MBU2309192.1 ATP-dependent DNA helicase RecG [Alphaproteobacteria bacterium]